MEGLNAVFSAGNGDLQETSGEGANGLRACTACVTGHRSIPANKREELERRLDEVLGRLIARGVVFYGVGMALGFDTMAVGAVCRWHTFCAGEAPGAVLRQRERNSAVKLIAVVPCRDQDARWLSDDRATYRRLLAAADKTVYTAEAYFDGCMKRRNEWLVANSGVCIAYMRRERSGSGQTVRMARARGLELINLAEGNGVEGGGA